MENTEKKRSLGRTEQGLEEAGQMTREKSGAWGEFQG